MPDAPADAAPLAVVMAADLLLRSRVEEGLRAAGYRVTAAAGPVRMRERLVEARPDVVLVDLEVAGAEAVAREAHDAGLPLVGFCGHTEVDLRARGLAAGCDRVITRGQVADRLDRLVAGVLEARAGTAT